KIVLALNCNIGDHDGKHPLVYVNSRYSIQHLRLLLHRSGARVTNTLFRVSGYCHVQLKRLCLLIRSTHTRRISQFIGLNFSLVRSTSSVPSDFQCSKGGNDFHDLSRAVTPTWSSDCRREPTLLERVASAPPANSTPPEFAGLPLHQQFVLDPAETAQGIA